jgi:hypothetical protein
MYSGVVDGPSARRFRGGADIPTIWNGLPTILRVGETRDSREEPLARTRPLATQKFGRRCHRYSLAAVAGVWSHLHCSCKAGELVEDQRASDRHVQGRAHAHHWDLD